MEASSPRDRLRAVGYDAPPERELCGPTHGFADTIHHRLWVCPHPDAAAARTLALCPPTVMRDALASDPIRLHERFRHRARHHRPLRLPPPPPPPAPPPPSL